MRHAFARVPEVPDLELAQLGAPQRVKQQRRQDRAVRLPRVLSSAGAASNLRAY